MSGDEEIQNTGASASQQPLLPAGLSKKTRSCDHEISGILFRRNQRNV